MARRFLKIGLALTLVLVLGLGAAHPHQASAPHGGDGQNLANDQNHAPFVDGATCGGDPAAYGLESAHHGPDSGIPGKGDGCYQIDGTVPGEDDENPAID